MALGRCGKCGDKRRLLDLVEDQDTKGLLVCPVCFDIEHPSLKPFNPVDGEALRKPAPDTDDDSAGPGVIASANAADIAARIHPVPVAVLRHEATEIEPSIDWLTLSHG